VRKSRKALINWNPKKEESNISKHPEERQENLEGVRGWVDRYPMLSFLLLAFGIPWVLMGSFAASQVGLIGFDLPYELPWLGQFGPSIAAFAVVAIVAGRRGVLRLLKRALRWKVGIRWYVFAVLFAPALGVIVLAVHWLAGVELPEQSLAGWQEVVAGLVAVEPSLGLFPALSSFADYGLLPSVLVFVALAIVAGGVSEEFGWRGYFLPMLQRRYNALIASLIVGTVWVFWHVAPPQAWEILFVSGILPFLEAALPGLLVGFLSTLPYAVLYTWLYNNTQGNLLLVILLHATGNMTIVSLSWFMAPSGDILWAIMYLAGLWIAAIGVILVAGPRHLSRNVERVVATDADREGTAAA